MALSTHPEDPELFVEPATHPVARVVTGRITEVLPGYPREVRVGQPVLVAVLVAAALARLVGGALRGLLRPGRKVAAAPSFKGLRKGPEFLVSPLRLRDAAGMLREVELHGYLSPQALERGDLVRLRLRRQGDPKLPPRVERLANLTTGQVITPHPPTLWSHLGPALVLQAVAGVAIAALAGWTLWQVVT
ncbi:MAG TPA: hypothetical protein VNV66_11190 [Pilimelia sp.]|nr:hypothetical protein [Pilimelia sp.]